MWYKVLCQYTEAMCVPVCGHVYMETWNAVKFNTQSIFCIAGTFLCYFQILIESLSWAVKAPVNWVTYRWGNRGTKKWPAKSHAASQCWAGIWKEAGWLHRLWSKLKIHSWKWPIGFSISKEGEEDKHFSNEHSRQWGQCWERKLQSAWPCKGPELISDWSARGGS